MCRDELEVLDANSPNFLLRPSSLPRSILLNADRATPSPVDPDIPVVIIFNSTTSLKIRFTQVSMWVSNIARVSVELRQYDDPRYDPALRVRRHSFINATCPVQKRAIRHNTEHTTSKCQTPSKRRTNERTDKQTLCPLLRFVCQGRPSYVGGNEARSYIEI